MAVAVLTLVLYFGVFIDGERWSDLRPSRKPELRHASGFKNRERGFLPICEGALSYCLG
jgi:hypothetical protein